MSFAAISIGTAGVGLAQSIIGGISAHSAQKKIENTPTPVYQPSKGINDYYQEALNRYSTSPYASMMYQQAQNRIAQSQAGGINALQDRRSALSGVGAIVGQGERALGQAGVQAENMRRQDFSTLGRAAEMKAGDDQTAFQYNKLLPYQKRMSILGAKAAGGNQMLNAGMQNVFGGISGAAQLGAFKGGGVGATAEPYATYSPGLESTVAGGYQSPAAQTPYINPGIPNYINPYSSSVMAGQ